MAAETLLRCGRYALPIGARTLIMGVINVTDDSFSGDGLGDDLDAAVQRGLDLAADGADILDVGGESTRPGHTSVPAELETARVAPVIERLAGALSIPISVDTHKAPVARAAILAGASLVNDVTGLRGDPEIAGVTREAGAGLVLQHWNKRPHGDVIEWLANDLAWSVQRALSSGVDRTSLVIDPGLGFGKRAQESLEILRRLDELKREFELPILVGPSRKGFIGYALGDNPVNERLEGSLSAAAVAVAGGADIVRAHDVAATVKAVRVADAIVRGAQSPA